jgi:hypothetical protein
MCGRMEWKNRMKERKKEKESESEDLGMDILYQNYSLY